MKSRRKYCNTKGLKKKELAFSRFFSIFAKKTPDWPFLQSELCKKSRKEQKMEEQPFMKHCSLHVTKHFATLCGPAHPHSSAQFRTQNFLFHFSPNQAILSILSHTCFLGNLWSKVRPSADRTVRLSSAGAAKVQRS